MFSAMCRTTARTMLPAVSESLSTSATSAPVAIIVSVKIAEERTAAFLETMAVDASGSRQEPGCHTFDLLKDDSDPQKFYFYEVYKDADAVAFHRETPHYKAWANFKAEGGVISQEVIKASAIDFTY